MSDATCKTCPFWNATPEDRPDCAERECRVRSPAAYTRAMATHTPPRDVEWPFTKPVEWTGETWLAHETADPDGHDVPWISTPTDPETGTASILALDMSTVNAKLCVAMFSFFPRLAELVARRERACREQGGPVDGSDGRYARARAALAKARGEEPTRG